MSPGQTFPAGLPGSRRIWASSSTVVLAAHALFALGLATYRPAPPLLPPPMAAMMLDLAPGPLAAQPRPVEPPPPRHAAPVPEPVQEPTPAPVQSEVALPKPKPKLKPRPQPRTEQPLPAPAQEAPAARHEAPPAAEPAAAKETALPPTPAPSNAIPTWQGLLSSHLERYKRYPAMAQARRQQGVSMVRFVIDRNGKVLSATLEKSSGVERLDRESLDLLERAEPLPVPPADLVGAKIELVVPIRFFLKS